MPYRIATEADLPAMLEIYAPYVLNTAISFETAVPTLEAFTKRFRAHIAQCPWLVWEEDGKVVGYAYAGNAFERAAYGWAAEISVYLAPQYHKTGIGKALYAVLENALKKQGYRIIYALVTTDNEGSVRFHEALGYKKAVLMENCGCKFGKWYGVQWLEKRFDMTPPTELPRPWLPEDLECSKT